MRGREDRFDRRGGKLAAGAGASSSLRAPAFSGRIRRTRMADTELVSPISVNYSDVGTESRMPGYLGGVEEPIDDAR